jgi:hypothetical protein
MEEAAPVALSKKPRADSPALAAAADAAAAASFAATPELS